MGVPVYTHNGKNVVTVNALKASANIGFFKGALLTDKYKLLQQQGNVQSARIIRFTKIGQIEEIKDVIYSYVTEAIYIEERGDKVILNKNPDPVPEELTKIFKQDPAFKKAFYSLTAGRQRGYILYFSQPKQTKTRIGRIEKYKQQIFNGIDLNGR